MAVFLVSITIYSSYYRNNNETKTLKFAQAIKKKSDPKTQLQYLHLAVAAVGNVHTRKSTL
jgi:hypothetical protein